MYLGDRDTLNDLKRGLWAIKQEEDELLEEEYGHNRVANKSNCPLVIWVKSWLE